MTRTKQTERKKMSTEPKVCQRAKKVKACKAVLQPGHTFQEPKQKSTEPKVYKREKKVKAVLQPCHTCQQPTYRIHGCCRGGQCKLCWEQFLNSGGEFDKNSDLSVRCNMCQKSCSWTGRVVTF